MKHATSPPSLTCAVDTVPLVERFIQTPVRTSVIRTFWRGDRLISTHLDNGCITVVEVDLEGRATTLAPLSGRTCYFLYPAGPHVIAGVTWGKRSDETEVWLIHSDRSPPRLLMHGDPDVARPEVMLPPIVSRDGELIALEVHDGKQRSRVRIVDTRGTTLAEFEGFPECWDDDGLVVSEYDEATETIQLRAWNPQTHALTKRAAEQRAPYLVDETTRGTYEITNTSTGQILELAPTRKRERDLLIRYRWKHGARRQNTRHMVIQLGDSFLVDCEAGRSWTILPGEHKLFLTEDLSALGVVTERGALLLARLQDRWRTCAPPVDVDRHELIEALGSAD